MQVCKTVKLRIIIAKTICTNFQNEMCIFPIFSRFVFQLGISFKRLLIGV